MTKYIIEKLIQSNRNNKVEDDDWYDSEKVFIQDREDRMNLSHVFGYFWHYLFKVSWALVIKKTQDQVITRVARKMELKEDDIVFLNFKDEKKIEEHSPDTVIALHHDRNIYKATHTRTLIIHNLKEIVVTVCGTKITPAPSMGDIMLDLHADAADFLQGRSHQGMGMAATTLLEKIEPSLVLSVRDHPDYTVVIIGYSLGAGVAQLLTLAIMQNEILPPSTKLYCLGYGPPPAFRSNQMKYDYPNIISIVHHNDGLATLSLNTFTKLFLQIRAIDRLNLPRRTILKMMRTKLGEVKVDEKGNKVYVAKEGILEEDNWRAVSSAIASVSYSGFDELDLLGGQLFLMKNYGGEWSDQNAQTEERDETDFTIRHLRGLEKTRNLSSNFRLRMGALNDHMPWSYCSLFEHVGRRDDSQESNATEVPDVDEVLSKFCD